MRYTKPLVLNSSPAASTIKGLPKPPTGEIDGMDKPTQNTAYPADE